MSFLSLLYQYRYFTRISQCEHDGNLAEKIVCSSNVYPSHIFLKEMRVSFCGSPAVTLSEAVSDPVEMSKTFASLSSSGPVTHDPADPCLHQMLPGKLGYILVDRSAVAEALCILRRAVYLQRFIF